MGFKIISNRDKDGNFIASADYWQPDKVEELLMKYNPNGKMWYRKKTETEKRQTNLDNE
ncbi:hypothetical protein [Lactovum miscens]|uniref:Uncharacterized protein n=1 Tax=Lactovum miscens TaxID=190387 RepID=A0A841C650_9LACT|nr:hypothetical protein [Lactovum miscens]MBB5887228.1 hypothetical protein [Lactovum miscens]